MVATKLINIILALTFWIFTFFLMAFSGDDPTWFLLYLILSLSVTLMANFLKGSTATILLAANLSCMVRPAQEVWGLFHGLLESSSERFVVKHILIILFFLAIGTAFLYTSFQLLNDSLRHRKIVR
jgi:hypothetical protein